MQPTDQLIAERAERYRKEAAILLELERRHQAGYPDLAPLLDLPKPPLD